MICCFGAIEQNKTCFNHVFRLNYNTVQIARTNTHTCLSTSGMGRNGKNNPSCVVKNKNPCRLSAVPPRTKTNYTSAPASSPMAFLSPSSLLKDICAAAVRLSRRLANFTPCVRVTKTHEDKDKKRDQTLWSVFLAFHSNSLQVYLGRLQPGLMLFTAEGVLPTAIRALFDVNRTTTNDHAHNKKVALSSPLADNI